jgi:dGTPase
MLHGGFEGNAQSLRIITETAWTEKGINPSRASVDAILKYKQAWSTKEEPADRRSKFLYDGQGHMLEELEIDTRRCLECQIMDLADDIGNALIDFGDAVRADIITEYKLKKWAEREADDSSDFAVKNILKAFADNAMNVFSYVRMRDCIGSLKCGQSLQGFNRYDYWISLDPKYQQFIKSLKQINSYFLFDDPEIRGNDNQEAFVIRTLFEIFLSHYLNRSSDVLDRHNIVSKDWHGRLRNANETETYRVICDYLSGMTDDFAQFSFDRCIAVAL